MDAGGHIYKFLITNAASDQIIIRVLKCDHLLDILFITSATMEFPAELWYLILSHLPTATQLDNTTPLTLINIALSCRFLREIALESSLWEPHYKSRWLRSESHEEIGRHQRFGSDFQLMFAERQRLDRRAHTYLTEVVEARELNERQRPASLLASQLGYDVLDTLNLISEANPEKLCNISVDQESANDTLSRQFWAIESKNLILRHIGVSKWTRLNLSSDAQCSLEDALSVLSTFVGGDLFEVSFR